MLRKTINLEGSRYLRPFFPNGIYKDVYYEPLAVNREGRVAPVQEIFQEHGDEHLVLMGEGGIGKTTFLAHQLSVLLKDKAQVPDMIPVYVELNRCPSIIGDGIPLNMERPIISQDISSRS